MIRLLAFMVLFAALTAFAFEPQGQVTVVSSAPAGSALDTAFAPYRKALVARGVPVVMDYRSGGSGVVAHNYFRSRPADGHNLLLSPAASAFVFAEEGKQYTEADFEFVGLMATSFNAFAVPAGPVVTPRVMLRSMQVVGVGSTAMGAYLDALVRQAGVARPTQVAYRVPANLVADAVSGRVDTVFASAALLEPLHTAGKLQIVAISDTRRHPALPGVPAMAETVPGFAMPALYALALPAGAAPSVGQYYRALLRAVGAEAETRAFFERHLMRADRYLTDAASVTTALAAARRYAREARP